MKVWFYKDQDDLWLIVFALCTEKMGCYVQPEASVIVLR